jgi:hypothetical protein
VAGKASANDTEDEPSATVKAALLTLVVTNLTAPPAGWRFPEETLTMLEKEVLATTPGPRVAELPHSG